MKILLITQFFPPETGAATVRAYEHARQWVNAGHEVTVITNVPNSPLGVVHNGYKSISSVSEIVDGIRVERVVTYPAGKKHRKIRRLLSALVFLFFATLRGVRESDHDVVIGTVPYFGEIPAWLTSKVRRIPFVYEFRDPWLQVASANQTISTDRLGYKLLKSLQRKLAKDAKCVVVVSHSMACLMKTELRLNCKPSVMPNGVNPKAFAMEDICAPELPRRLEGKFVVGIIGNMGSQYDFDVILRAAEHLESENCEFLFLGDGSQLNSLRYQIENRKLRNVCIYPSVPSEEVGYWIKRCDVTVVSMRQGEVFDVYLPLKALDSLYLETSVILVGSGELENLLSRSKGGSVCEPGDAGSLAKEISHRIYRRKLLVQEGQAGKNYVVNNLTRRTIAINYLALLKNVVEGQ